MIYPVYSTQIYIYWHIMYMLICAQMVDTCTLVPLQ